MKLTIFLFIFVGLSTFGVGTVSSDEGIIAADAELELLADTFEFSEGPASDAEGNVYFTDQPNDRILKYGVDDTLSTFLQPCGRL